MKKFILLIALSVLFYSVPGHADQKRKKAAKEVAKKRRAARVAAAIEKTAAAKARAERQKANAVGPSHQDTRRKSITAALAAASEATVEKRQAALAAIAAALAEATVVKREAAAERAASLAAAEAASLAASLAAAEAAEAALAEAVEAPATEAAPSIASLERQLEECVESLAQTVLDHAQGVSTVFQEREDALNKYLPRINAMVLAIFYRKTFHPLAQTMSREEKATDEGCVRRADISALAFLIQRTEFRQRKLSLADLAQDKELFSTIIQKASALQAAEATPEAAWQVQGELPVETAVPRDLTAAERAEEQTVEELKVLCRRIRDNGNTLPTDMQRRKVVALSEKTLREMGDILSEMDIELMGMLKEEIAHYKEVLVLWAILRKTVEGDYEAVKRCHVALVAEASYTSESTELSTDPGALFERCTALMSDVNIFDDEIVLETSEYIADAQKYFDSLMELGISLVETFLDPLVESEEEAKVPAAAPSAASLAAADDE